MIPNDDRYEKYIQVAEELAKGTLSLLAERYDREGVFPAESVNEVAKAGLLSLAVPLNYGGQGADLVVVCRVLEELGRGCTSTALILAMHWISLFYLGDWCEQPADVSEQKLLNDLRAQVFSDVVNKGALLANCYGEPGSGANIFLPFTQAVEVKGGWRVTGRKFGTSAKEAQYIQFHAVIADGDKDGQVIQFVIPSSLKGITVESFGGLIGVRSAAPARLILEDCFIQNSYRFGPIGGFIHANSLFPYSTLLLAAPYLGLAQAALDSTREHLKNRKIQGFKLSLAEFPQIQRDLAKLVVEVEAARSLLYRAANEAIPNPASNVRILNEAAKYAVGEMVTAVTVKALQMCGTRMLMQAFHPERYVRDSLAAALHPPTSPEALDLIGSLFLGVNPVAYHMELPGEYRTGARQLPEDKLPGNES